MKPNDFLPPISIIVHVHNAAATLDACMESILMQEYPNLEILLFEDSSTDNSVQICLKYSHRYDFVQVYPSAPQGAAHAWNDGIRQAKGYYLMFVSCQDTLPKDALNNLTEAIYRHDLASGGLNVVKNGQGKTAKMPSLDGSLDDKAYLGALIRKPGSLFFASVANKLYRSDIIFLNGLFFDPALGQAGDFAFNMQYLAYVARIGVTQEIVRNTPAVQQQRLSLQTRQKLRQALKSLFTGKELHRKYPFRLFTFNGKTNMN